MTIELIRLKTEQAVQVWPVLAPMLEKAIPYSAGRVGMEDVFKSVVNGDAGVLIIADTDEKPWTLYAVFCAEAFDYPKRKVMSITLAGGKQIEQWGHMWPKFLKLGRAMGFDQIEVSGRPGWKRFLTGAEEVSRTFVQDLGEEHGRQEEQDEAEARTAAAV